MKHLRNLLPLLLAAALSSQALLAQLTSGNITGVVSDQSGAAVPNATVTATNNANGAESTTKSSGSGAYQLSNLLAGSYTIKVAAPGFSSSAVNGVNVDINRTVTANIELQVGTSSTSVEVTDSPVALDTATAQIQSTFETKQITDLPGTSTGAGVLNLSLLAPGVTSSGAVGAGTGPSVGGQRPRNNNFTIEGIDNNSGSVTGPLVTVPQDAVAEFTLVANQYSAEFGHSSGGQFNQVVKSGTNQFHGMLFDYFQNRNLNAADNLLVLGGSDPHPRFDNNRFGGNIGGPIRRNKLFFFADYEYNPIGRAGSAGILFAPSQAGYSTLASIPGVSANNLNVFRQYLGAAPTKSDAVSVGGRTIPIGQISIGTPNYTNNEFGVGSVDYNISEKDSLRARFVLNRTGEIDTAASLPTFFTTSPTNNYLATFSEYHNFTATLVNEFRLGYNKYENITPVGDQVFPGLNVFPNLQVQELGVQIGPNPNAPQYTYQNTYQLTDNLSWTKGNHTLKVGFDGQRNISPQSFTQRSRGDYEWNTLEGYLFDQTPDYLSQRSAGNPIYWGNRWLFGWFANDIWKVRPNLTLNLGLRYEYQTVPAGEQQQSLNSIASVPGLISFNTPKSQPDNLMPRVGLAYTPDNKTSIRAGFGINYDVLFDNLGLLTLPPQLSTTQDTTGAGGTNFLANGGLPATGPSANFTVAQARARTSGFVPDVQRPKSLQWNFGIQRQIGSDYIFETRYLGTRGINLPVQQQLNRTPVVTAANALPLFYTAPSQATLNSLTNTLGAITAAYNAGGATRGSISPQFLAAGFTSTITSYQPIGNSVYHGWANQLTRRFANGLQMTGSYTYSHNIDDSTAEVFSTYATPRRPQNSQNLRPERASSALDHRNRLTFQVLYDFTPFKNSNWFMKNLVGNWELAPIYTYQTGTYYTVQSGADSNRNGDAAPDRAVVNPNGNPNIGSGTTPLLNTRGQTVGYLVSNPNAGYISAPVGVISTAGRNTSQMNPINNIDVTAAKRLSINERSSVEFSARFFNVLNHSQYIGGYLNDVRPLGATSANQLAVFTASNPSFGNLSQGFTNNPRTMVLTLKLLF